MAFGKEGRGGGGRVQQASSLPGWTVAGLVVSCRGCKGDKVDLEWDMAVMAACEHVYLFFMSSLWPRSKLSMLLDPEFRSLSSNQWS